MTRIGRGGLAGVWALAMLLAGCTPVQPFQASPPAPFQSTPPQSTPAESAPAESPSRPPGQDTPPAATPPPSPYFAQPAPHPEPGRQGNGGIEHIVIIVQENKAASQIMGASEAGYFNKLAAEFSTAANYRAIIAPSCPTTSPSRAGPTRGSPATANRSPAPPMCAPSPMRSPNPDGRGKCTPRACPRPALRTTPGGMR